MNWAVVMAGGQGTRFWPLTDPRRPKQLLPLVSDRTMLEETVRRLHGFVPADRVLVVTNELQAKEVRRVLPKLPRKNVIAEPRGRSTAPCIGLAAHVARRRDPDAMLIVLPADQVITKRGTFLNVLKRAVRLAEEPGMHVTLGIRPSFPATGYGYIEAGKRVGTSTSLVKRFIEKPPPTRARKMYRKKRFVWNSGMFIWRADTILDSLERYLPRISKGLKRIAPAVDKADFSRMLRRYFPRLPAISVDYGVMEKAPRAAVLCCEIGWNDVGSWDTAATFWKKDRERNAVKGAFLSVGSSKNMVWSESGQLVACVGVHNLAVVATRDHILVCDKSKSQDVRRVQAILQKKPPRSS